MKINLYMKTCLYITLSAFFFITACKKKENPPIEDTQTPANTCGKPSNLGLYTIGPEVNFHWENTSATSSSYYQFEYGITGFSQGSGTVVTTSGTTSTNVSMAAGNAYQFYVRGYCDATGGFSDWAGPFSYYSDKNHNMCLVPSNVQYTIEVNGFSEPVGANFTWDHNGETNFEYTIVANGASPANGNIHSISVLQGTPTMFLTQNTEYDFYVRAVCKDGNKTNWVGPKNVNIGG
ncbi:hypothetical protein D3C87_29850 [compost metagenome]